MCSLHTAAYPQSLVVVSRTALTIGAIDEIKMLQIRTVPLFETPAHIAHQEATSSFAVLTTLERSEQRKHTHTPKINTSECKQNKSNNQKQT
jgi:hypothetical protein